MNTSNTETVGHGDNDFKFNCLEEHLVPCTPQMRLSDYAVSKFESLPSRKSVKKAIKRGLLLVNGEVSETGHWVKKGEVLTVIYDETVRPIYERTIEVLYQDDHLAAVQKPADIPVSGNSFRTLQNSLSFNLEPSSQKDALAVPRPVHRLDRLTGGVILIAKTLSAAAHLGSQFENRTVEKTYFAWVSGLIESPLILEEPIDKKEAITGILPLRSLKHRRFSELTLVEAKPKTGRRNQIRIHLSEAGYPILGDLNFNGLKSGKGLFLFAKKISFVHPKSSEQIEVGAKIPRKFQLT
ncbi:RluA family pseudouridine synthase [Cryomorphaceae bacterium 1068]|nr:RluA family pseudouridine synthase [Cryomorphaceae bacterium 1068]